MDEIAPVVDNPAMDDVPPIKFARTRDGIDIAYATVGEGRGLIYMQGVPTRHFSLLWKLSEFDRQLAAIAAATGWQWVMFDPRGHGSSGPADQFTLDGFVADLEAVVDALEFDEIGLVGATTANPIAVEFAVRHPERVSRLVLHYPFLRAADALDTPAMAAVRALRHQDWSIFADAAVHIMYGASAGIEENRIMARLMLEAVTPENAGRVHHWVDAIDIRDRAPCIRVPTLVLTEPGMFIGEEFSREVAVAIPHAQFLNAQTREVFAGETWRFLADAPRAASAPYRIPDGAAVALTPREREVLARLVEGDSNREIGLALSLSERTAARHIANIYAKTGAHGRVEVTGYALRHGLVEGELPR